MAALADSKTVQNLKDAFAGESQANRRYLYFAKVADVEGHPDIAGLFRDVGFEKLVRGLFASPLVAAGVKAPQLHHSLHSLARRAGYINVAISLATVAALMVALVVVALFANAFFLHSQLGIGISLLFVGAMLCLSAAFVAFFIEVRIAVAALRIEIPPDPQAGRKGP